MHTNALTTQLTLPENVETPQEEAKTFIDNSELIFTVISDKWQELSEVQKKGMQIPLFPNFKSK